MSNRPTAHPAADALAGRRVLVTGAAGFLGSHLVRALAGRHAEVIAVTRRPVPAAPNALHADLSSADAARRVIKAAAPDLIVHLAGHPWAPPRLERVQPTFRSGPLALVNLLTAAAEAGRPVRVVCPGSQNEPRPGAGEAPTSPYAAAKAAETLYCELFAGVLGLPVVRLRLFVAYGPGQHPDKLIPAITRALLRGESPLIGNPDLALDWIHVDDVAEALLAACTAPVGSAAPIDVGTGRATPLRTVAELLAGEVGGRGRPQCAAAPTRPLERGLVADTATAARVLGWRARVSLEEGLARTVAALRAGGGS